MKNKTILHCGVIFVSLILSVILLIIFFVFFWVPLTYNCYFIPQESSIFRFEGTIISDGSGECWLYGRDNKYYYAAYWAYDDLKYFRLQKGNESKNFDEFDYHTWGEWLYGEGDKYYYAVHNIGSCDKHYCTPYKEYFKLQKGYEPEDFDKFDYYTWGEKNEYICGE